MAQSLSEQGVEESKAIEFSPRQSVSQSVSQSVVMRWGFMSSDVGLTLKSTGESTLPRA